MARKASSGGRTASRGAARAGRASAGKTGTGKPAAKTARSGKTGGTAGKKTAGKKAAAGKASARTGRPAARAKNVSDSALLAEYNRKRDFGQTPEPAGRPGRSRAGTLSFVIQKHAATRLHYDFRLELAGVLKSWAVPKGPSLDPGEKRLAVHVEDHPLDYGGFEGTIPKGQYGGGTVLLWDRGTWEPTGSLDAAAAYRKGHLKFRLEGEKLHGGWNLVRMGRRSDEEGKENWLLLKEADEEARPGSGEAIVEERPESVETGRDLDQIAAESDRVWQSNRTETAGGGKGSAAAFKQRLQALAGKAARKAAAGDPAAKTAGKKASPRATGAAGQAEPSSLPGRAPGANPPPRAGAAARPLPSPAALPGARKGRLPSGGLEPQLATLVSEAPRGEEWVHEIKFDGYRTLCEVKGGRARMWTRSGKDWTDRFTAVADAAAGLPVEEALLDGEVVVQLPDGTTSFQALQNVLSNTPENRGELLYFAFDLLHLDGWDLRGAPLLERKRLLAELLAAAPPEGTLRLSEHVQGRGEDFFRQACGFALEGVISKRADQPYRPGRGKDWLKVKCLRRQEFVVVGYTDPEGSRTGFGALLLAVNDTQEKGGGLVFAGKVGTGFGEETLRTLTRRLQKLQVDKPAFRNAPRGAEARRSHWVRPELVAEVAFTEWTSEGILRHPSFQGLREDKSPDEVVRERAEPAEKLPAAARKASAPAPAAARRAVSRTPAAPQVPAASSASSAPASKPGKKGETEVAGVRLTNPGKVLFPGQGLTKLDLAHYYERIADHILPYIADRPLTLVRCPEGQARQCFYQKHVTDQFPPAVRRVDVGEAEPYGAVDTLQGILSLVQMGVLELHIWGARRDRVEQPDYIVFDLDPDEGLAWERVALGALTVRHRLAELGLKSFLKTTGGKGLHVAVPLVRRLPWDEVKAFTKAVSEDIVAAEPQLYTSKLPKLRRQGKVFIDYLRNGRGATSICAFSTRSRPGAPVSAPLAWEELEDLSLRGNTYTVENLPDRLANLKDDPWAGFWTVKQSITRDMRKAVGL